MTFQPTYPIGEASRASGAVRPPVLVARGRARAGGVDSTIEAAGLAAIPVPLDALEARLALQARASLVWLDLCEADPIETIEQAVRVAGEEARARDLPVIVSADILQIDPLSALLEQVAGDAELLIAPDGIERASALAVALARAAPSSGVRDSAVDEAEEKLRMLSDEVGRIAETLARLSAAPPPAAPAAAPAAARSDGASTLDAPGATVSSEAVRAKIAARRLRERFFAADLFADPAWDMLLDLFQAQIVQQRVAVSSLCIAASVPPTTALRWIKRMCDDGLFLRKSDPHDGRRIFVDLSPSASEAMSRYFAALGG